MPTCPIQSLQEFFWSAFKSSPSASTLASGGRSGPGCRCRPARPPAASGSFIHETTLPECSGSGDCDGGDADASLLAIERMLALDAGCEPALMLDAAERAQDGAGLGSRRKNAAGSASAGSHAAPCVLCNVQDIAACFQIKISRFRTKCLISEIYTRYLVISAQI